MADVEDKNKKPEANIKNYDQELPPATARELYQDLGIKPKIEVDLENRQFHFLDERTQEGQISTHPVMNDKGVFFVFDLDKWAFTPATEASENIIDPVADHINMQIESRIEKEPELGLYDPDTFQDELEEKIDDSEKKDLGFEELDDLSAAEYEGTKFDYTQLALIARAADSSFTDFKLHVLELELNAGNSVNMYEFQNQMEIAWHEAINEEFSQELNIDCISPDLI